jgi:hypothetical protein
MNSEDFTGDVRQVLRDHIASFEQLEIFLLLRIPQIRRGR